ncbi:MAG: WecB/TagA/CpsF family glycosyltransferase, partial [Candidatus Gracilibacteria bacterium]|nr:WecB/TagA/CpsF family glycosyltransferase [Candidatus Gracilibacteria bacterium]
NIKQISSSKSKILFSTLGMKKQEKSIIEIMQKAKNIKLGLGIGSSFDYFIGFQKRAPKIWRQLGIEWLYRLITGPKKINRIKRLYKAIFVFIFTVIKNK